MDRRLFDGYRAPAPANYIRMSKSAKPVLSVVVDTEESFQWGSQFSGDGFHQSFTAVERLPRLQQLCENYGIRPTYAIDYPIATEKQAYQYFRELVASDRCVIGAQLHPWVNPPITEELTRYNSFPGNLPRHLETQKLHTLTEAITDKLEIRPSIYKAGRYGIGKNTVSILKYLGYLIDISAYPHRDYLYEGGPDFRSIAANPYWLDNADGILEIPLTCGFEGLLRSYGPDIYPRIDTDWGRRLHLNGLYARLRLLNRVAISPEGYPLSEAKRLTRALMRAGSKVFTLAFHSPSLEAGNTPYTRTERDVEQLLDWMQQYFDFFLSELGGVPTTPLEILEMSRREVADTEQPAYKGKRPVRQYIVSGAQYGVGLAMRQRKIQDWPIWAAEMLEIKVPSAVRPNPGPHSSGGANINVLLALLERVRSVPGEIAECGVYRGATLLTMDLVAEQNNWGKDIYGFDSFQGFDAKISIDLKMKGAFDAQKRVGGFSDTSLEFVQRRSNALGISKRVKITPGYFGDTLTVQDERKYSFVHLDCDIYESYRDCLAYFGNRMSDGGIILLDEYDDPPWPGCNRAVEEFLEISGRKLQRIERDGYRKFFIEFL